MWKWRWREMGWMGVLVMLGCGQTDVEPSPTTSPTPPVSAVGTETPILATPTPAEPTHIPSTPSPTAATPTPARTPVPSPTESSTPDPATATPTVGGTPTASTSLTVAPTVTATSTEASVHTDTPVETTPTDAGPSAPPDLDGDGFITRQDCNDNDESIYPGAPEVCDGIDQDCDGRLDDGLDSDGDTVCDDADVCRGYDDRTDGDADHVPDGCDVCQGADDHLDGDADTIPDGCDLCEGFEDSADGDGDGFTVCEDCDDRSGSVHPGAAERCNGIDDDCDNRVDDSDGDIVGTSTFYADEDADAYGDPAKPVAACHSPQGFVENADDCDDSDSDLNPETLWYVDYDQDGWGSEAIVVQECVPPSRFVRVGGDCNDTAAAVYPGAAEYCNTMDDDCDGLIDEDDAVDPGIWYRDADGDTYGDGADAILACVMPSGYAGDNSDCDDKVQEIHPGAAEICDQLDNNCNSSVDEGFETTTLWPDEDGDGYGDDESPGVESCVAVVAGYSAIFGDCDDTRDDVYPDAPDYADPNLDSDCDGIQDDCAVSQMVGHWRFNETAYTGASGEVLDYSCAGNHARSVNSLVTRELSPTCRHTWFDGATPSGGYVQTPIAVNQVESSPGYAIMAWVYPQATSNECAYTNCGRHMVISSDTGGYDWSVLREYDGWNIFTGCESWYTGVQIQYNQWHHIAAVFDPTSATEPIRFYYDGIYRSAYPYFCLDADVSDFSIGDNPSSYFTEFWKGYLDEVRIYVGPLDTTTIQEAMEESMPCALEESLTMP